MTSNVKLSRLSVDPLVSIVMPSFNQAAFIRNSIESILNQNYRPIELIIQDGASKDGTIDILKEYENFSEVKIVSEPDNDVCEAVNRGFNRVSGEIIAIQSSDDLYYANNVISEVVSIFKSNPEVGLIFGNIQKENFDGKILFTSNFDEYSIENFLLGKVRIPQESAFFRREALELTGCKPLKPIS